MSTLGRTRLIPFFKPRVASFRVSRCLTSSMNATPLTNVVDLNDTEQKIKSLLVLFCDEYNQKVGPAEQLELRITGGWVRDKLLGKESNDLDIAINLLSGEDFASKLLEFSEHKGIDLGKNATSLHTIKKNPEKSKHLETCTTKLFGLDIDFVNLRNEQYTEDSRVPIIECGTAEEDALRRDATLNALFYNLNQSKIEDFTGRGLSDLESGILRTPLQPLQTFLDDPLRVLRLMRFASRFNFIVEPGALQAMKDERIRTTLLHKISRERVGVETEKILTGDNVPYGLRLINHVGLTDIVFRTGDVAQAIIDINDSATLDKLDEAKDATNARVDSSTQAFTSLLDAVNEEPEMAISKMVRDVISSKSGQKLFWLCATLHSYGGIRVKVNPKKLSTASYVETIIKEGLRFGKQDYDTAASIIDKMYSTDTLGSFFSGPGNVTRADLGMYVRLFGINFNVNVVANLFQDILDLVVITDRTQDVPTPVENFAPIDHEVVRNSLLKFEQLLLAIKNYELEDVVDLKPLVDGKLLSKTLQRKPGPWMSKITPEVLRWQLDNPKGTQEECIAHIREILRDETP